LNVNGITLI